MPEPTKAAMRAAELVATSLYQMLGSRPPPPMEKADVIGILARIIDREMELKANAEAMEACRLLDQWDGSLGREGCVLVDAARRAARAALAKLEAQV